MENELKIIAKTSFGLEDVLIEELKQLGVTKFEKGIRAVIFYGDKEVLYKANLWLRTASRLIVPFQEFTIKNDADLYKKMKAMILPFFLLFSTTLNMLRLKRKMEL